MTSYSTLIETVSLSWYRFRDIASYFFKVADFKYVATLPCNLLLMARFADSNVSRGSVATYARCGGIFNVHLTANLPRNLPVKKKL